MIKQLPKPTGRFAIGRVAVDIVDVSRTDTSHPEGLAAYRKLVAWVWFPAERKPAARCAPYLPPGWEASDTVFGLPLGTSGLQSHCLADATPVRSLGKFPLVLFSASGFSPLSYAGLLEELASHGYVVAGICHTHDAPITVFGDGSSVPANLMSLRRITAAVGDPVAGDMNETFTYRAEVARLKRDDMASIASLLPAVDSPLTAIIDDNRIGAFGHSLGGNAALEWCRTDERCLASANLDGAIWTEVGVTGLTRPAMVLAAEHPEMLAPPEQLVAAGAFASVEWCIQERDYLFNGWRRIVETGQPGSMHTLADARHANFCDLQFADLPEESPMRRVLGSVEPESMLRQVSQHLLTFFANHLR